MAERNSFEKELKKTLAKAMEDEESPSLDFYADLKYIEVSPEYIARSIVNSRRKNEKRKVSRAASVAAASFMILAVSSAIAILISSNPVDAIKSKLERQFIKVRNVLVIKDDNPAQIDTMGGVEKEIEDWKDIGNAKKFLQELFVPGYIPEGYEFQSLKIKKDGEIGYYAKYQFINSEGSLLSINQYYTEDEPDTVVTNANKMIETNAGNVYITVDEFTETIIGTFFAGNDKIVISGAISEAEIETLCNSIQ
ncbi:hypothetical protein [Sinanaerobacter chloroacetimidivorans]|jgi:hypothetical protein|uniref:DUF4367 domain-containing protein n=1 Tax=Sinanaerobacter chloroacetimidivorans TaxID=2818044 RepID=A0A8J7W5P8_9FIRM|nr:hypothetical protein [Sinanaerobacter chloroacetimidivorans]MBR0599568.1 hypothetical protein [Sinanaerobacter chloroacetimidivorans]